MTFPRVRPMCLVVSGLYNQFMRCLILIVGTGPSILVLYECVGWSGVEWSGGSDYLGGSSVVCIYRRFLADDTLARRARTYDFSFPLQLFIYIPGQRFCNCDISSI